MKLAIAIVVYSLFAMPLAASALGQAKTRPTKAPETGTAKTAVSEPTVDQILEKYVQALGGREALEKITSRVTKGTLEAPDLKGEIEIYAKAPNKLLIVQDVEGIGVSRDGYDGQAAWAENPMFGVREKSGPELAAVAISSDFHAPLKIKQHYSKLEVKGKEKIGDREAWIIQATSAGGTPLKMYYDTQTGLHVRTEAEMESLGGKISVQTTLEDYRDVDGVKLPFTTSQETPMSKAVIRVIEVKSNVTIDDARFKKPSGQ
jgi:hypothetical protein